MTVTAPPRSAYPTSVDELIPHARDLAANLGTLPSRNKIMKTFRVGPDKAKALLAELTAPVSAPPAEPRLTPGTWIEDEMAGLLDAAPVVETTEHDVATEATPAAEPPEALPLFSPVAYPGMENATELITPPGEAARRPVVWPVLILCLPAFVAIWAGWVEMGRLTGFGKVVLLPGIADGFVLDTAITLPIGVETYAAYALWVWLSGRVTGDARNFAKRSAIASLAVGALGQIAYHLMTAWHWTAAPWPVTAVVACIPVAVLGMGAALAHLMHARRSGA